MGQNLWEEIHRASEAGVLAGVTTPYGFTRNFYWIGANAPLSAKRVDTIEAALARAISNDVIMCGPQTHAEAGLIVPALDPVGNALREVTLIGAGASGDMWLNTGVAGDTGLDVRADYTTLVNFGIGGGGSAAFALNIRECEGFRAFGCAFEGGGDVCVLFDGNDAPAVLTGNVSYARLYNCEFKWCDAAILFGNSLAGYPTQIEIQDCLFHNYSVVGVGLTSDIQGGVVDLWLTDCVLGVQEDGTEPTDFIKIDRGNDDRGIISGCRLATATNSNAVIEIGTGIHWVANATEAGWSTARPA